MLTRFQPIGPCTGSRNTNSRPSLAGVQPSSERHAFTCCHGSPSMSRITMAATAAPLTPIWECAVSLGWLLEFAETVPDHYSTEEVAKRIIVPATAELRCRYVDLLRGVCCNNHPAVSGQAPYYFLSHRGSSNFKTELLEPIKDHFMRDPGFQASTAAGTYVFLDCLAVNQVGHPACWPLSV